MFHTNDECLIGISDAYFAFCLRVSVILPTCSLYPPQKRAYILCATPAGMDLYIQLHARRHLPRAVPWISEDRLLNNNNNNNNNNNKNYKKILFQSLSNGTDLGKIQGDGRKFLDRFKSYFGSQISSQSLNDVHIYRLQPKSAAKDDLFHIFLSLIVSNWRYGSQMANEADEVLLGKWPC